MQTGPRPIPKFEQNYLSLPQRPQRIPNERAAFSIALNFKSRHFIERECQKILSLVNRVILLSGQAKNVTSNRACVFKNIFYNFISGHERILQFALWQFIGLHSDSKLFHCPYNNSVRPRTDYNISIRTVLRLDRQGKRRRRRQREEIRNDEFLMKILNISAQRRLPLKQWYNFYTLQVFQGTLQALPERKRAPVPPRISFQ